MFRKLWDSNLFLSLGPGHGQDTLVHDSRQSVWLFLVGAFYFGDLINTKRQEKKIKNPERPVLWLEEGVGLQTMTVIMLATICSVPGLGQSRWQPRGCSGFCLGEGDEEEAGAEISGGSGAAQGGKNGICEKDSGGDAWRR